MGSDHCPVSCELFDEINEGDSKVLLFEKSNSTIFTPNLCAKNLARFSGNQQTLKSFFTKQEVKEKEENETLEKKSKSLSTSNDRNISMLSKSNIFEGTKEQVNTKKKARHAPARQVQKFKKNPSKIIRERSSQVKSRSELSSSTSQPSLMTFFKKTSQDALPEKKSEKATELTELLDPHNLQGENIDSENMSDYSEETLDDMLNIIDDECSEVSSSNNKKDIQSQWNDLFKPRTIPNCTKHGEPCKEYTVNKPGKNRGRLFYLCSRPVGNSQESRCNYFEWANGKKLKFPKSLKRSYSNQEQDSKLSKKKREY